MQVRQTNLKQLVQGASSSLDEAYFDAILVDYGPKTRISRTSDGVVSDPSGAETCWGESSATDDACYRVTTTLTTEADQGRVSKGILDGQNRNSYAVAEPRVPGEAYEISLPLLPNDYVFPAGNRIGVVLVGSYRSYSAARIFSRPTITVDAKVSRIALPVVLRPSSARARCLGDHRDRLVSHTLGPSCQTRTNCPDIPSLLGRNAVRSR
jgi:X-Pro dipeptidyl-peptidase